jgi:hypothetical protein
LPDNENVMARQRSRLYVLLIVFASAAGFAYGVRDKGIFACQAVDPASDRYLGICNVDNYGDYDHGAFWYSLEPAAVEAAARAEVLFIGNSRLQFGLSAPELDGWFVRKSIDYYLLGFSHNENYLFFDPLLEKLNPQASLIILNVDNFFEDRLSGPADTLMHSSDALNRYRQKRLWQRIHRRICWPAKFICGHDLSFIRSRENGTWIFKGDDLLDIMATRDRSVSYDSAVDQETVLRNVARARDFFDQFSLEPGCIVLTNLPKSAISTGTAEAIAVLLGLPLVAPTISGLHTFDLSHLDPESASRWSSEFIRLLGPHVEKCVDGADS